jgi:hypothetical protein
MTPERVLATIARYRFNFVSESDLHDALSRHASIARSFNGKPVHVVPTFRA